MLSKKIRINNTLLIFMMAGFFLFAKFFQFSVLPSKYFNDSNTILSYMEYMPSYVDSSYVFITKFFRVINIFHFTTLEQWAILFTIIFFFIYISLVWGLKYFSVAEFCFFCCELFLSGIYIFNIGKEVFQILVFLIIYYVIISKKISKEWIKILLVTAVLACEGFLFRGYFLFIASLFVILYYCNLKQVLKRIGVIRFVLLSTMMFFLFVFLLRFLSVGTYNKIISIRYTSTHFRVGAEDARTLIVDWIHIGNEFINWCVNCIINGFRMFFPVELITKGVMYIPFVLFQFLLTIFYIRSFFKLKEMKSIYKMMFFLYTSYALVSIVFEPDFGSWIRHETTLWPILLVLFFDEKNKQFISLSQNSSVDRERHNE